MNWFSGTYKDQHVERFFDLTLDRAQAMSAEEAVDVR